jgi:FixJ family two-component response regulator
MDSPSTVFLVDDDSSVRKGLTRLIKSAGHEVRSFATAREFLDNSEISEAAESGTCLILDVRLPELNGLDLQQELKKLEAPFPIIFITGHGDIPMTVRAMKAGAVDFLSKPIQAQVLLSAIDQALARSRKENAERAVLDEIKRRLDNLTPREREVMQLVVKGYLNKQIAFELGTVEKTVKVHRARVMQKMKAHSLAELVHFAERAGATTDKHSAGTENTE